MRLEDPPDTAGGCKQQCRAQHCSTQLCVQLGVQGARNTELCLGAALHAALRCARYCAALRAVLRAEPGTVLSAALRCALCCTPCWVERCSGLRLSSLQCPDACCSAAAVPCMPVLCAAHADVPQAVGSQMLCCCSMWSCTDIRCCAAPLSCITLLALRLQTSFKRLAA